MFGLSIPPFQTVENQQINLRLLWPPADYIPQTLINGHIFRTNPTYLERNKKLYYANPKVYIEILNLKKGPITISHYTYVKPTCNNKFGINVTFDELTKNGSPNMYDQLRHFQVTNPITIMDFNYKIKQYIMAEEILNNIKYLGSFEVIEENFHFGVIAFNYY